MINIRVVSGHPVLVRSVAKATIHDEVAAALPDAEICRLDGFYPDGKSILVRRKVCSGAM